MSNQPKWWTADDTSTWDRVKSAMKRDWEQTKSDLSGGRAGMDLDQGVTDTVKQATGSEPLPQGNAAKSVDQGEWDTIQDAYRFGVGAKRQYGGTWNSGVETSLAREWGELNANKKWEDVAPRVRRAWAYDDSSSDGKGTKR